MTDLQMLRAILVLSAKRLKPAEKRAFQGMYDDLQNGVIIHLSKKQRAWVKSVYQDHDLHMKPLPPKKPPTKDKRGGRAPILDFGPLPKKPPGFK